MSPKSQPVTGTQGQELIIRRIFDAPRERVWKACSEPKRIMRWWGPEHFTAPTIKIDFRVGGAYHFCMRSPEGEEYWTTGVFREIVPIERIVYTDSFADERANRVPASHYGMGDDWPEELPVTLTFKELAGETEFTLRQSGIPASLTLDMASAGWNGSLDKLAESLKHG